MEAHAILQKHGLRVPRKSKSPDLLRCSLRCWERGRCHTPAAQVSSFGVNGHVKLPGASQREPIVYVFGTPY